MGDQARRPGDGAGGGRGVAIPFASALLAIVAGWALSGLGDRWGHPLRLPYGIVGPLNHGANEDKSAFGPWARCCCSRFRC